MIRWQVLPRTGPRPPGAHTIAGGWTWATHALPRRRGGTGDPVPLGEIPPEIRDRLTAPRAPVAGLGLDVPRIMAILNTTPDSFSDGGRHDGPEAALAAARRLVAEGADILDVGGESTRPGAAPVPAAVETARTAPVIARIRAEWDGAISIDTRNAPVAQAAADAGATLLNDVSAFTHDPAMAAAAADRGLPVCLMHAQGDPATMQDDPRYDDVLLDVYDHLEARIAHAEAAGIPRGRIICDPGIGFGKTVAHNIALLRHVALFHALGCPILLGASRKGLIGQIAGVPDPQRRMPGSLAITLHGVQQGVQIHRVHDMAETRQALALWAAITDDISEAP